MRSEKELKYNKETEEAIEEARKIMNGEVEAQSYNSAEELFKDMEKTK